MFLGLSQVYDLGFKCNTHNNYNDIIKTKRNYFGNYLQQKEKHQAEKAWV